MTRLAFIIALLFTAPWEETESVDVRDFGPVNLRSFNCQDITRSSLIERVCYDETSRHMIVRRNAVYDQYCELPKDMVDALLNAPSMGQYFKVNIAGNSKPGPYDCGTRKAS
jgi:KTSC domain